MKKQFLFLMLFGCAAVSTVQAQSLRNNNAPIEMAAIQVDVGPGGYYNDGFYDNCQVWAGPGWYYGYWFNAEPTYYNWCGTRYYRHGYYPYYRRGYGYGWHGRGWRGGHGWRGGRGGHRGGRHH